MNTLNKVTTWNPLREMDEAQNRLNRIFLGGFPSRIGSGEIHSLAVGDWSPEVRAAQSARVIQRNPDRASYSIPGSKPNTSNRAEFISA